MLTINVYVRIPFGRVIIKNEVAHKHNVINIGIDDNR